MYIIVYLSTSSTNFTFLTSSKSWIKMLWFEGKCSKISSIVNVLLKNARNISQLQTTAADFALSHNHVKWLD